MNNALLFVLVLITGCEAAHLPVNGCGKGCKAAPLSVSGCVGGWFEFTCNIRNNGELPEVSTERGTLNRQDSEEISKWTLDTETSLYWYHNTTGKYLRLSVQQLTQNDFGDYTCRLTKETTINLQSGGQCLKLSNLTANRGANHTINCTITCTESEVNFICKNDTSTCIRKSLGRNYTISHVSEQDQGDYLCGCQSPNSDYRVSREKIQLLVLPIIPTQSPHSTALPQSNTTQSQHSTVNASIIIAVLAVVCVIILSLAIAFCFYKKWCFFAKPTPALLEEHCYDEIQERPQQLSSETAVQTVYATATLDNVKPGPDSTEDSTDAAFEDNVLYE
ncbi:uncharacterized protein LOC110163448 [Boleophthalmus pectinirostris]|uniref:uncharacterized protein LOC110163448 n=1 Tax=Boleophthalmus pectinirostris TaxID=150288 RepID=UPI00242EFCF0|nr:uncharacterized protein LOC110163448 [Boleophthalmus pectinirostris]